MRLPRASQESSLAASMVNLLKSTTKMQMQSKHVPWLDEKNCTSTSLATRSSHISHTHNHPMLRASHLHDCGKGSGSIVWLNPPQFRVGFLAHPMATASNFNVKTLCPPWKF